MARERFLIMASPCEGGKRTNNGRHVCLKEYTFCLSLDVSGSRHSQKKSSFCSNNPSIMSLPLSRCYPPRFFESCALTHPFLPRRVDFVFLRKLVCQVWYQISLPSSSPFLHEQRAERQLAQPLAEKVKRNTWGQIESKRKNLHVPPAALGVCQE